MPITLQVKNWKNEKNFHLVGYWENLEGLDERGKMCAIVGNLAKIS